MPFEKRIDHLQQAIRDRDLGGAILFYSRDIYYYTGTAQPSYFVVLPNDYLLFVRRGYEFARRESGLEAERIVSEGNIKAICQRMFPGNGGGKKVGAELDVLTVAHSHTLRRALGDRELVDIPACVEGYHGDQSRTYAVGEMSDGAEDLFCRLREVADSLIRSISPGMRSGEAFALAEARARELGIGDSFMAFESQARAHFVGHGIGLEVNEPPLLVRNGEMVLEAGMVLAIEMHVMVGGGLTIKLEDTVHLTEKGIVLLSSSPRELTLVKS
jgi:Xaa-Pro aminopeptidase